MRIDEIDLYGNILISGSTGSEGQILTYGNGGEFAWGTASGGSGGPTSSYFKTSGYNYVICETVNNGVDPSADAIINGTNLQNAYNLAKTLDVGTKSATNRVVVLLMPGDYDLSSAQFQLDTSFVDIVGISTNPYNAVLRSSTQYATLQYTAAVDSSLKNVNLKQGTSLSVDDNSGAGDGSYLRWENLILEGNLFSDGYTYAFQNIYGEFRNIKILNNSHHFAAAGNIDGIFDNIEALGTNYTQLIFAGAVTPLSTLTGTFSNINFNASLNYFCSNGILSGYYENINILDATIVEIFRGYSINGTFKNITIGGVGISSAFVANSDGDVSGTFENIQISDAVNAFYSVDQNIYGTYKNIEIYNLTNNAFYSSFTMSGVFEDIKIGGNNSQNVFIGVGVLLGSFKNIEIGDVAGNIFTSDYSIDTTFENIKVANVTGFLFSSQYGPYLQGTFSNIESGDASTPFYSAGTVSGYFSDIKLGNSVGSSGCFRGVNGLIGYFENIEVGDMPNMNVFHSNGEISATFNNIKIGESNICFQSESSNLLGTFENIEFGEAYSYAFNSLGGNIDGTFNNIKTNYPTNEFLVSFNNLTGTFSNIEVSQIKQLCFYGSNQLSGSFKNIKIGDLSLAGHTFYSGTDLTGTFENIEVGNGNSSYDIFKSYGGSIIGTFSNIKIGDNFAYAFFVYYNISGYYKDITIGDFGSGYIFYSSVGSISVGTTIDNLYSITRMYYTQLNGRLINSTIIDSVNSWYLSMYLSAIVENCKLITNGGYSIIPSTGGVYYNFQVLYTATNGGFDNSSGEQDLMSPNFNITDAGLT